MDDIDPDDEADWSRQHKWLVSQLNNMHHVFFHRVRTLDADAWGPEESVESTDQ